MTPAAATALVRSPKTPVRDCPSRRRLRAVVFFALLFAAAPLQGDDVAERILAVVDTMPVLLSETRLVATLQSLDIESAREALIDELLMYREAARLPKAVVSPEEVATIASQLQASRPGLVEEVGEQGLERLVRRQASILRYVEFRFRPQVRVSDQDIHREWTSEAGESGPPPSPEQSDALRQALERRALDARVEAWVGELRRQARLRYNRSPSP